MVTPLSAPAAPAGAAGDGWSGLAFAQPLRRYQRDALHAFDRVRDDRGTRAYLVMPPGSGKTVVGLEAARRLGRRTIVLAPNVAVQQQWLREWGRFSPTSEHPLPGGSDRDLSCPLTVLTYQSLAVLARDADVEYGEDAQDVRTAAQQRRSVLRTGTHAELLGLLHPNGRKIIDRAVALRDAHGPLTLVLDECHHLLEMWGGLLRALIDTLGPQTAVVALTATPSVEMTAWQRQLHDDLFDERDFFVPTPSVVKEGDLAPFQELLYLCEPTVEEDSWVQAQTTRFAELSLELSDAEFAGVNVVSWLSGRLVGLRGDGPDRLPWQAVLTAEPDLARAALRMAHAGLLELPDGAALRERDRVVADAADWACVLSRFAVEHLRHLDSPSGRQALADVQAVLPMLGVRLSGEKVRSVVSPIDKLVELSSAKHDAAADILAAEFGTRAFDLRALVLCDFERDSARPAASLRQIREQALGGAAAGSARSALIGLAALRVAGVPGMLRPVLVTGRTLAAAPAVAGELRDALQLAHPGLVVDLAPFESSSTLVELVGPQLTSGVWTPVVTAFFAAGRSLTLIGTRGLLGEGWDCPALNVVVDLTSAATATAVAQLRGRSLRRDPARPDKVANNWTVACVAQHPRGDADYQRAVRKHAGLLALTADGVIETAITHCDAALSPYAAPSPQVSAQVRARSLERAADLDGARADWRVGQPYAGQFQPTLRLRATRTLGISPATLPARLLLSGGPSGPASPPRTGSKLFFGAMAVAVPGALAAAPASGAAALALLGAPVLLAAGWGAWEVGQSISRPPVLLEEQSAVVTAAARAIADAMLAGKLSPVGGDGVAVTTTSDGSLQLTLTSQVPDGAGGEPSAGGAGKAAARAAVVVNDAVVEAFLVAVEEALSPVGEPRWLISRPVVAPVASARQRAIRAARIALGRPVEGALVWHAVPTVIGRSQVRLRQYTAAWQRHVCGGQVAQVLNTADPAGLGVLDVIGGLDPYGLTAQMRTVWH